MNLEPEGFYMVYVSAGGVCSVRLRLLAVLLAMSVHVCNSRLCTYPDTTCGHLSEVLIKCTRCTRCLDCLCTQTGQTLDDVCLTDDDHVTRECATQLIYIYSRSANASVPCYRKCRRCARDLQDLGFSAPGNCAWSSFFPGMLDDPEEFDDEDCRLNCADPMACTWNCPTDTDELDDLLAANYVYKRDTQSSSLFNQINFESDLDVCCETSRASVPYRMPETIDGVTWYPVWMFSPLNGGVSAFQYYSQVECADTTTVCNGNNRCRLFSDTRTFLMTTYPPHEDFGHSVIIVTNPNSNIRFIRVSLPCYCRCTAL